MLVSDIGADTCRGECLGGAKRLVPAKRGFGAESQAAASRWSESTAVPLDRYLLRLNVNNFEFS